MYEDNSSRLTSTSAVGPVSQAIRSVLQAVGTQRETDRVDWLDLAVLCGRSDCAQWASAGVAALPPRGTATEP